MLVDPELRACFIIYLFIQETYWSPSYIKLKKKRTKDSALSHKIIIKICILFGQAVLFWTTKFEYIYCTLVDQNLLGWACAHSPTNFFQGVFQLQLCRSDSLLFYIKNFLYKNMLYLKKKIKKSILTCYTKLIYFI